MRFRTVLPFALCAVACVALAQQPPADARAPSPQPRLRVVLQSEPFHPKLREIIEAEGLRLEIVGRADSALSTVLDGETVEELIDDLSAHAGHLIVRRGNTIIVYAEGADEILGAQHVTYAYTLRGLQADLAYEQLQSLTLPGLHVAAVKSLNTILLRGPVQNVNAARQFLETVDQKIPNVMIELLVVEYFHGDQFRWGFDILDGTRNRLSSTTIAPGLGRLSGTYSVVASLASSFKFNLIALVLDRAAKVVTNPHVSVRNADKGTIRLDETQNIIVTNPTDLSGTTRTLQPITSSVVLEITPVILDENRIHLAFHGEVGIFVPSETTDGIPGTETNKIDSSVNVANGETLIVGGLIKEEDVNVNGGVPYLRRVPLLGYLFKETEKRRFYTETVIYITPRIADQAAFQEPLIETEVRERLKALEERDKKFKKRGW